MSAKKRLMVLLVAVMVLSIATASAFADSDGVPSNATVYGAGTCHYGFTTSRSISRGSGWNSTIHVSSTYVLWDDFWEFDMYEDVYAKSSDNVQLSETEPIYTGTYNPQPDGVTENPGTNKSDYTPFIQEIELYAETAAAYSQIFLRIEKPSCLNYANGYAPIDNMKVWGYFWK